MPEVIIYCRSGGDFLRLQKLLAGPLIFSLLLQLHALPEMVNRLPSEILRRLCIKKGTAGKKEHNKNPGGNP